GSEGMKLFNANSVDLVITDIVMPEKEGIETIMEIRKAPGDVKVIAISGGGRQEPEGYLELAKQLGVKFTFTKPFKQDDLLGAVHELLKGKP
ncbi:MAG: response regulator, partial [bacterium]|nr:response regulator [bacterium]